MRKIISTTVLSLLIAFATQAQEKIHLKISPEIGKSLNYEMTLKTDIEGAQDIMMDMSMAMTILPTAQSDSIVTFEAKYTKVTMDVNAGIMMVSYDSSIAPEDEMGKAVAEQIKPLLENTLTLMMSRSGKIKNIDLPNVSEQAFDKSSLRGFALGYPEKPISIGDTWTSTVTEEQLGANITTTNTLVEKNAEGYKIMVNGVFLDEEKNELGKMDGYYIIDSKTHFTKSSSINSTLALQGQKIATVLELKLIP